MKRVVLSQICWRQKTKYYTVTQSPLPSAKQIVNSKLRRKVCRLLQKQWLLFSSMITATESTMTILDRKILSYETSFFNMVTTISYAFLPSVNKSLHTYKNLSGAGLVFPVIVTLLKCTTHCSLCSYWLFGPLKCLASVDERWVPWHTFMKVLHLNFLVRHSDCPPTTICCTATKHNEILVRRFRRYHQPLSLVLWFNTII